MGYSLRSALFLGLAAVFIPLGSFLSSPPSVDEGARSGFSVARAYETLRAIAARPHPTGSAENERVLAYLSEKLRALGLEVSVQDTVAANGLRGRAGASYSVTRVKNLIARLRAPAPAAPLPPGATPPRALLVMTHYDSVPTAPGAGDDGAAVAAALEVARILAAERAARPLRREVIFLISDGEELGLLGATAFVDKHPLAKEVAAVVNFEARGAAGASLLFETSSGNAGLVSHYAAVAPGPVTSSLFYQVYKSLPNDTDFSVTKRAGIPGLNFAFIDAMGYYHAAGDTPDRLDPRSLQHHGSQMLALVRRLDAAPDSDFKTAGDSSFFSVGAFVVRYPAWLEGVVAALAALACALALVLALRRRARAPNVAPPSAWAVLRGFLTALFSFLLAGGLFFGGIFALTRLEADRTFFLGGTYGGRYYVLAILVVALLVMLEWQSWHLRRGAALEKALGALFFWSLLGGVVAYLAPGGAYLLGWTLLFTIASFLARVLSPRGEASRVARALAGGALVTGLLVNGQLVALLSSVLGFWLCLIALVPACFFATTAHLLLFTPARPPCFGLTRVALPVAVALVAAGALLSAHDAEKPRQNSLFYAVDLERGAGDARFVSLDAAPDEWTARALGAAPARADASQWLPFAKAAWSAPAPLASESELVFPTLEIVAKDASPERTLLRLRVAPGREARDVSLFFVSGGDAVRETRVGGEPSAHLASSYPGPWRLVYRRAPAAGFTLDLTLAPGAHPRVRLTAQEVGLPAAAAAKVGPRPAHHTPLPNPFVDGMTVTTRVFDL